MLFKIKVISLCGNQITNIMKKQILTFLLGGLTFLCVGAGAATSTEILTVKPATPKTVIVKSFRSSSDLVERLQESFILDNYKKGYILKQQSITFIDGCCTVGLVVMEKY